MNQQRISRFEPTTGQCDCAFGQDPLEHRHAAGQCDCAFADDSVIPLSAWLHLTDRCNLRCAYCYLPHQPTDMSPAIGEAAIRATFRSAQIHGYRQVKLKYAGGEPLLAFEQLVQLQRLALQLADEHAIGLESVVLSNGTLLTSEMIDKMQALQLRLVISLDQLDTAGVGQRVYANGRHAAADVMRAIDLARGQGLIPGISITVSGRNAADLADVVAWVLERTLPVSLNFYRTHDCASASPDLALDTEAMIAGMRAAYRVIEQRLPAYSLLSSLLDRVHAGIPHTRPCSVGHSYLVFDEQGGVSACQMQRQQQVTTVDAVDPLEHVRQTHGRFNVTVDHKADCVDCAWKYWCAGGCPLAAYRTTGSSATATPVCAIYQALLPDVLRLEGLRLLAQARYAQQPTGFDEVSPACFKLND
ncbi:MAG: radical SAM protein [Chloroflexaceae bacterium]|nr:radical SAM protein [Chloroflexaceae bacterium]